MVAALAEDEETQTHPLCLQRPVSRRTLVVITADRGLCGAFNANLLKSADGFIDEHGTESLEVVAVGNRALGHANRRGLTVVDQHVPLGGVASFSAASALGRRLVERFTGEETDEVTLLYTHLAAVIGFEPTFERLLPLGLAEEAEERRPEMRRQYIFEPDAAAVLGAVLPRTVESRLYLAMAESVASEHSARRMAMHNATDNCKELSQQLTQDINRARQASITKELLEIIGGAEALKG